MKLVLLHGRSQHDFNENDLKREWIGALREGLAKSNLVLNISEDDIVFPYYGKLLMELIDNNESYMEEVIEKGSKGEDTEAAAFFSELLNDIAANADISDEEILDLSGLETIEKGPLNWPWIQAILRALDSRSFLDQTTLKIFTHDVYCYLKRPVIGRKLDEFVRSFIPDEECVWVGHSLGSVITYNILGKHQPKNIREIITLGSPLGLNAIRKNLETPLEMPGSVINGWYNAYDRKDVVSLFPLEKPHFSITPAILNYGKVLNDTKNKHGITGYLKDREVALRIYNALR